MSIFDSRGGGSRPVMPAEFEPHDSTVMCWPARHAIWAEGIAAAERAHAEVANTIARFEPVTMVAHRSHSERARAMCGPGVEVVEMPIDDSWARDTAPIWVRGGGAPRTALDFSFNGWGGKFVPHDDDAAFAGRLATRLGHDVRTVDMVLEGGSINVMGRAIS